MQLMLSENKRATAILLFLSTYLMGCIELMYRAAQGMSWKGPSFHPSPDVMRSGTDASSTSPGIYDGWCRRRLLEPLVRGFVVRQRWRGDMWRALAMSPTTTGR